MKKTGKDLTINAHKTLTILKNEGYTELYKQYLNGINFYVDQIKTHSKDYLPPEIIYNLFGLIDDEIISHHKEHPEIASDIKCKKGCSFCCHQEVTITSAEADLLLRAEQGKEAEINWNQAEIRSKKSSLTGVKCPLLSFNGTCSAYKYRPAQCRTQLAISSPQNCDTSIENQVAYVNVQHSEMIVTAILRSYSNGDIGEALLEARERLKK